VVFRAGSPKEPIAIVRFDMESRQFETVRQAMNVEIPAGYVSTPEAVEFPTENGLRAHAFFYAPTNQDYEAPRGERPPLLVMSHGGTTSAAPAALSLTIQYFTSRGIAVADVNYGGSTGYGREYRERLKGNWGVVDLDDCVNAARFLAEGGFVDAARLMITGGS